MPRKAKWGEIACPECLEPVAAKAKRCPHCQTVYSIDQLASRQSTQETNNIFGVGCLVLVIGAIALVTCSKDSGSNGQSPTAEETSTELPKPGTAPVELATAVRSFHGSMIGGMKDCDEAASATVKVFERIQAGSASVYDGYDFAERQSSACLSSYNALSQVAIPDALTGALRDQAEKTRESCKDAAYAKKMAADTMKDFFDGNSRPSKLAELKDRAASAQGNLLACVAGGMDLAAKAGVDVNTLPGVK